MPGTPGPSSRKLVRQLLVDAVELAKNASLGKDGAPGFRAIARQVMTNDSFQLLVLFRLRERARAVRIPGINHVLRRAMTAIYGIEIGNAVTLGDGIDFVHPIGIVIGGDAKVGARVRFMGSNTVGTAKDNGYPTLEDDVIVGAGARILGPIRIGARAVIGANAVVLQDVPADSVATGIPALARPKRPLAHGA